MEATQHTIDHPATLLIAIAVGQLNRLIERHWSWSAQAFQVNDSQSEDVPIDPRKTGQSPALYHLIQPFVDALALGKYLLNPLHGAAANLLLVAKQQQTRQLKTGGQPFSTCSAELKEARRWVRTVSWVPGSPCCSSLSNLSLIHI